MEKWICLNYITMSTTEESMIQKVADLTPKITNVSKLPLSASSSLFIYLHFK